MCRKSFSSLCTGHRRKVHRCPADAVVKQISTWVCLLLIQNSRQCGTSSASTLVVSVAGEPKLGDHQVGEAKWHEAINLCQPVQTVGPLEKVFRTVPHTPVPTVGIFFQVAQVHGFNEDPRGFVVSAHRLRVLPQILCYDKVHGNIITVLRIVHQCMYCLRLVLEELQVAVVEKGSADQHHGVFIASSRFWILQFKAAITEHPSWCGDMFSGHKTNNLVWKLLPDGESKTDVGDADLSVVIQHQHSISVNLRERL